MASLTQHQAIAAVKTAAHQAIVLETDEDFIKRLHADVARTGKEFSQYASRVSIFNNEEYSELREARPHRGCDLPDQSARGPVSPTRITG